MLISLQHGQAQTPGSVRYSQPKSDLEKATSAEFRVGQLKDEFLGLVESGTEISPQAQMAFKLADRPLSLITQESFLKEALSTARQPARDLSGLAGFAVGLAEQALNEAEVQATTRSAVNLLQPMATENGNLWAKTVNQSGTIEQKSLLLKQLADPSENPMAEGRELANFYLGRPNVIYDYAKTFVQAQQKLAAELAESAVSQLPAGHPERALLQVAKKAGLRERLQNHSYGRNVENFKPIAFLGDHPAESLDQLSDKASQAISSPGAAKRMLKYLEKQANTTADREILDLVKSTVKKAGNSAYYGTDWRASRLISGGVQHLGRHSEMTDQNRMAVFRDMAAHNKTDHSPASRQKLTRVLCETAEEFAGRPDFKACVKALSALSQEYHFPIKLDRAFGILAEVDDAQDPVLEVWREAAPEAVKHLEGGEDKELLAYVRTGIALKSLAADARDPELREKAKSILKNHRFPELRG